ncbi:hypothetical protein Kpol_1045p30 [Vanderwaltozyma polyspora DSM 70294]|uniref:HTH APSES-type domain-containing protein n=1 Tax=Vanderwaltozyma polyspora (strain ATCC 22028 / DSM 70294 / BCRC 21397 / CBS 2163 / NBRC 10782 / NRRL Y-8283 / UCD 57-17) TaxID=436907 RepID=A7TI37_VANPO|nr:uncharacterized protein Kpol_1045p30 [Vanderwaltozyma polyspora DSM 70294]EDO18044.1 hypothetical protein Kpol_1045p30 [Vanderwaltozyma polyspora DSM 70294]
MPSPIIEIATYSETDVYECYIKGQESRTVMRRTLDDWINITQVFKLASFSKTKRTKILEKETKSIDHEKIQGGYGRFQGTWIPLICAKTIVIKYNIEDPVVSTILNFTLDTNNIPPKRSKNSILKRNSPGTKIISPSSYKKTPKKRDFSTVINSSQSNVPPLSSSNKKNKKINPSPLQTLIYHTPQQFINNSISSFSTNTNTNPTSSILTDSTKNSRYSASQKPLQFYSHPNSKKNDFIDNSIQIDKSQQNKSVRSVNDQFIWQNEPSNDIFSNSSLQSTNTSRSITPQPLQQSSHSIKEYKDLLMLVLSSEECTDVNYTLPQKLYHPPQGLDVNFQVDDQGHSTLHWAAAMANLHLVRLLVSLNANLGHVNSRGFNCITKLLFYNNCYKAGNINEILSTLRVCLITPDTNGRLPVHYLVELSVNKSKDPEVINFYFNSIIFNLKQNDHSLLRMCLNYQDSMGNTVLHLAALNLNLELYNKLLKLGCSPEIKNFNNETPTYILSKLNLMDPPAISPHFSFGKIDRDSTDLFEEQNLETIPLINAQDQAQLNDILENLGNKPIDIHNNSNNINNNINNKHNNNNNNNNHNTHNNHNNSHNHNHNHNNNHNNNNHDENSGIHTLATPVETGLKPVNTNSMRTVTESFDTTIDDNLKMDSVITSSLVKDVKITPSQFLITSPEFIKRSSPVLSPFKKINNENFFHVDQNSPTKIKRNLTVGSKNDDFSENGIYNLSSKLTNLSKSLVNTMNQESMRLKKEIQATKIKIESADNALNQVHEQEGVFLKRFKNNNSINTLDDIKHVHSNLQEELKSSKKTLQDAIRKEHDLSIMKTIKLSSSNRRSDTPEDDNGKFEELREELDNLKRKRENLINSIVESRVSDNNTLKLLKYKKLLGGTEELEELNNSKLTELENELVTQ